MKTIFKYSLTLTDRQLVEMPAGAKPLTAHYQGATLCLWCAVETDNPSIRKEIVILGTGGPGPSENLSYVATVHDHGFGFVWHVFAGDEQ